MQNKTLFLLTLLAFSASATQVSALTIDEIMPRGDTPKVLGVSTGSLLGQIEQAKQMLRGQRLEYTIGPTYTAKKKVSGYTVPSKDIALAILDPSTNQIRIAKGIQRNEKMEFPDKNFDIKLVSFNGVNSRFAVNNPAGGTVIALKYLITKDGKTQKEVRDRMYEGIYVPYSANLKTPEVIEAGKSYLNAVIAQAELELAQVRSHSHPGQTLVEAIPEAHIKALIYAEHVSMWEYNNVPRVELINKVNTLFGSNGADTYKYSVSSAGASGLAQFMPSTYASLVKRRKDIKLKTDFVEGMRDHVNAVKAMYGLLDDYLSTVKTLTGPAFVTDYAFDYAAAAYNGGPVKVARAANNYGHSWHLVQPDSYKSLRNETANYVIKIRGFFQTFSQEKPHTS